MKRTILAISLLLIAVAAGCSKIPSGKYKEFAQCLTEKEVVMYGTFWCPNCVKQEKMFGDAWQYATYIECDPRGKNGNPKLCLEKKVDKYPTWDFADGSREIGVVPLETLARKANCELPNSPEGAKLE